MHSTKGTSVTNLAKGYSKPALARKVNYLKFTFLRSFTELTNSSYVSEHKPNTVAVVTFVG